MARTPHDPVAARLVSPELTNRACRYLRSRGIPAGAVDEILDLARMQLVERGLPATPVEVDRLLFRIVRCRAMDWHRETKAARLYDEGFTLALCSSRPPVPSEVQPPPVPPEALRALQQLEQLVEGNPRHARAFEAVRQKMGGKSLEQYAEEIGMAPGTLRQWVNRLRTHARDRMPWCVASF
jgi:DNA-directed RNA polymerase specialized sigma24 family protein